MTIYGLGGRILCCECGAAKAPEDMGQDFGQGRGLCVACVKQRLNGMSEEDEATEQIRG